MPVSSSPVSSLTCCFHTLNLAVGHENGLVSEDSFRKCLSVLFIMDLWSLFSFLLVKVCFYILENSEDNTNFHFVTKSGREGDSLSISF